MPTYRMGLTYDGSGYRGYARQEGQRTVQGELEAALAVVTGREVETAVAGRTDSGVHARGQVVSFSAESQIDEAALARSLNGILGPETAVSRIDLVPDDFHARFSAIFRRYRYQILASLTPDPLARHQVWHVDRPLDLGAMSGAAGEVRGEHDFSSFCRSVEGKDNIRRVDDARWEPDGDLLTFWIQANAFCHQMVRSIVGLCYDVGRGFTDPTSVPEIIRSGDRSRVATVAPAHGLTLWEVGY